MYMDKSDIWEMVCEEAYIQLVKELDGYEPSDKQIDERAEFLIENSYLDYDAMAKDIEFDY